MAKGVLMAHAEDGDLLPTFLSAPQRARVQIHIANRLFILPLSNPRAGGSWIVLRRLRNTDGTPTVVTPLNPRGVWWVSVLGVGNTRAHNLLKRLKTDAWRVSTISQLRADNSGAAAIIKASPDVIVVATRDADQVPVTFRTALSQTLGRWREPTAADDTEAGDIDAGTAEPLGVHPGSSKAKVRPTRK